MKLAGRPFVVFPSVLAFLLLAAAPARSQSAAFDAALQRLERADPRWRASVSRANGLVHRLRGGTDSPRAGTAEAAARAFLEEHAALFALDRPAVSLRTNGSSPMKRFTRVEFQELFEGLEVDRGTLVAIVGELGRVVHVTSDAWPIGNVALAPEVRTEDAPARFESAAGSALELAAPPQLVVLREGAGRLAYRAIGRAPGESVWRELVLDARDGALVRDTRLELDGEREWLLHGPVTDVRVSEIGLPADPFEVRVELGGSAEDAGEDDAQRLAVYAAGIELLPCTDYRFRVTASLATWDAHNGDLDCGGYRDVFLVNVNSEDLLWQLLAGQPIEELFCDAVLARNGGDPPGATWAFGGDCAGDGALCRFDGSSETRFYEPDSRRIPELALALDASRGDERYPSWGLFEIEILAPTLVFSPNAVLGDPAARDRNDRDGGVACSAYEAVTLDAFGPQPGRDGYWRLAGDYVFVQEDLESPIYPEPRSRTPDFPFTRSAPEFEAVMCYHHLEQSMKHVESLGYALRNKPIRVDPHGLNGADNSHYVPDASCAQCSHFGCGSVAFGEGGVDDAEDADVILHEYGHALQDDMSCGRYFGAGDRGRGNETGAMGEGFGDYWACSHFADRVVDPAAMAEWDAQDPLGLRRVDGTKQYPTDMQAEVHADGEIWSAALWHLFGQVGKERADDLVLGSHLLIGQNPTFIDGALALLDADALAGGSDSGAIVAACEEHGILRRFEVIAVRREGGVDAQLAGVPVHTSPADVLGASDGATPFTLHHDHGELVTIQAPAHFGKLAFRRWVVDGYAWPIGVNTTKAYLGATEPWHLAVAVYE